METLPVTRLDFVTVLPRVLSLYVMSFLSPRDLCAAAQVSWQWRILSEQVGLESNLQLLCRRETLPAWACPGNGLAGTPRTTLATPGATPLSQTLEL